MTARIRILIALSRPPVFLLLALYAAIGMAGLVAPDDVVTTARVLLPLAACQVFCVAANDLSDQAIDAVNLAGDRSRPLVWGDRVAAGQRTGGGVARREMTAVALVAAVVALGSAATLGVAALAVVAGELLVGAAYSLRPIRLADRGVLAAVTLAVCFVVGPFLLGRVAAGGYLGGRDALLLAGLGAGFVGRIVLKDFRDVRGDTLYGKRTFLVRRGRTRTCVFSGALWIVGTLVVLLATPRPGILVPTAMTVLVATALWLLNRLRTETHPRRETALIAAVAIVGRGMLLVVLSHLAMDAARWAALAQAATIGTLLLLSLAQATVMLRHGPATRLTVPAEFAAWTLQDPMGPQDYTRSGLVK